MDVSHEVHHYLSSASDLNDILVCTQIRSYSEGVGRCDESYNYYCVAFKKDTYIIQLMTIHLVNIVILLNTCLPEYQLVNGWRNRQSDS